MDIYEEIVRLKKLGRISALATIVDSKGSSPQKQGAKMLVRDDGTIMGTLGGGCIEADVVAHARMAMQDGQPRTVPFELTEKEGGLVCGGTLTIYIEPIFADPRLVVLGAGHVGKALAKLARFAGFQVTVADDRAQFANRDNIPDAHELVVSEFPDVFSSIPVNRGTYLVVATRGHNHDFEAVQAALRTDAGYIGLLGSKRKKGLLLNAMLNFLIVAFALFLVVKAMNSARRARAAAPAPPEPTAQEKLLTEIRDLLKVGVRS